MSQDGGASIIPTLQMRKLRLRHSVPILRAGAASFLVLRMALWGHRPPAIKGRDFTPPHAFQDADMDRLEPHSPDGVKT